MRDPLPDQSGLPVIHLPPGATDFEKKKVRHASGASAVSAAESIGHWIPTPPDGGYGWIIVLASFLNHVIVDGIAYTFGIFKPEFEAVGGEGGGEAKTSLVGSLMAGFYMFTAPVASALVNKFGCRPVAVAGALIACAGFVLSTLAHSTDVLIVTYGVIGGSGLGILYLPNIVAVSYYFEKRRAIATGVAVCGAGVGCFAFAPLGRLLIDLLAWRGAMLIIAGVALNGCVFGCLLKPLKPAGRPVRRARAKNLLDRLREQTAHRRGRHRKASESSECGGYGAAGGGAGGGGQGGTTQQDLLRRIQAIKWAKESALKEEEEEEGAVDYGGSVLNSVMTLGGAVGGAELSTSYEGAAAPIAIPGVDGGSGGAGTPRSTPHGSHAADGLYAAAAAARDLHDLVERDESGLGEGGEGAGEEFGRSPGSDCGSPTARSTSTSFSRRRRWEVNSDVPYIDGTDSVADDVTVLSKSPPVRLQIDAPPLGGDRGVEWAGDRGGRKKDRADESRLRLPNGVCREDYARPMYRQDIFYSGSIVQLEAYRSQPDVQTYAKSVVAIPAELGAADAASAADSLLWRRLPLWKEAKDTLRGMTDCSLFNDPLFLVPALGNLLATVGLYVPFVFVTDRAVQMFGVTPVDAAFLLSIIGITNTIGRLVAGALANLPWCNSLLLHNVALLVAGVACFCNVLAVTYPLMCAYAAVFGLCIAAWISLTSIVLCDLLGLERLTNAFGLLCMARGCAAAIGSPIAGVMVGSDPNLRDYNAPFYLSGTMLIIGGLVCCLLHAPYFQRRKSGNLVAGGREEVSTDWIANTDLGDEELVEEVTDPQVYDAMSNGGEKGAMVVAVGGGSSGSVTISQSAA